MRGFFVQILLVFAVAVPPHSAVAQRRGPNDVEVWRDIKARLQSKDGDSVFESVFKDAVVTGGNQHSFTGTVVSIRPGEHPTEAMVAISGSTQPEVTLKFTDQQGREDHFK